MPLKEVAVCLFWTALLIVAVPRMRRYWRGEQPAELERTWRRIWPYGEAALQGWLRAQTAIYIGACFLLLAYLPVVLRPIADDSARPILALLLWVGSAGVVIMVAIAVSIVMFNVPKRVVFPALRDQEGMLMGWWRRRRARRPER